jgi:uncharacterized protein
MTPAALPRHLDLRKSAAHNAHFEGGLEPAQLERLRGLLAGDEGRIFASVDCALDDERRTVLAVQVDATLSVQCQRCLADFERSVSARSSLAVVMTEEQAAGLPEGLEPLIAVSDVDLWAVVEDELVLAMPVFSYHEDESCIEALAPGHGPGSEAAARQDEESEGGKSDNPFKVLAQLKRGSDH